MAVGETIEITLEADEGAAAFCASEHPRLVGALSLYVGDAHLAEELAQEALLRACRMWPFVSRLDSPGGWTWRVAVNLANSHFRRRQIAGRVHRRVAHGARSVHEDPDSTVVLQVRQAVAALPPRQRLAIVLRFFLDLSVADTASRMRLSEDAVRSLTKRGAAALRAEIGSHLPASTEAVDD